MGEVTFCYELTKYVSIVKVTGPRLYVEVGIVGEPHKCVFGRVGKDGPLVRIDDRDYRISERWSVEDAAARIVLAMQDVILASATA